MTATPGGFPGGGRIGGSSTMDGTKRAASATSLRALDALNVFLADVRDGLGPYLAIYLTMRHWDKGQIGIAMSVMGFASVVAQTPAGAFIDRTRHKRLAIAVAAAAVAIGAVAMVRNPTLPTIVALQILMGVASAIFAPAIAAVTLGLVGHACFSRRTGRNEAYNHAGNVAAAVLAMVIGDHIAYEGIFYLLAGMCVLTIVSTWFIRPAEIDHDLARGAAADEPEPAGPGCEVDMADPTRGPAGHDGASRPRIARLGELVRDRRILVFSASVVLFHLANAAMLPLAGQKLSAWPRRGGGRLHVGLHHRRAARDGAGGAAWPAGWPSRGVAGRSSSPASQSCRSAGFSTR